VDFLTFSSINMLELEAFTEKDFETLIKWVKSPEELVQFAGPIFSFPLTKAQLNSYLRHDDKIPFKIVLKSTHQNIGHCELNYGNKFPRLSRILIGDPAMRGKGLGKEIVRQMLKLIFDDMDVKIVDLNVFVWNKAAIKSYEGVGFEIIHENTDNLQVHGLNWTRLNMQFNREKWKD